MFLIIFLNLNITS